jgi:hypothetical protein
MEFGAEDSLGPLEETASIPYASALCNGLVDTVVPPSIHSGILDRRAGSSPNL